MTVIRTVATSFWKNGVSVFKHGGIGPGGRPYAATPTFEECLSLDVNVFAEVDVFEQPDETRDCATWECGDGTVTAAGD